MQEEKTSTASRTALQDSNDKSISSNSGPVATGGDARIEDRAGLYIAIVALIIAALSLGLQLNMSAVIDAKVREGLAQERADMAQQLADVKASANTAREHARVALDKVEQTQVQLGSKGLIKVESH